MSGFTFSEKQEEEIVGILAKYPFKKSAMLPLLTLVQRAERVISPEAMVAIGQKLDCSPAYVQSVLSFIRCTTPRRWENTWSYSALILVAS